MGTTADLAALIFARKQQLDRVYRSELAGLEVKYGQRIIGEALELVGKLESDAALSIEGVKARAHEAKVLARWKKGAFARR
jgi:hypothetical protein